MLKKFNTRRIKYNMRNMSKLRMADAEHVDSREKLLSFAIALYIYYTHICNINTDDDVYNNILNGDNNDRVQYQWYILCYIPILLLMIWRHLR